jgi:TonB family protein
MPILRRMMLLPLLAVGCASASQPGLLGRTAPQGDQFCRVAWAPDPLPPAAAVVDSAGLIGALSGDGDLVSGFALISLAADSAGTWTRTEIIESTLIPNVEAKLAALVRQNLRPVDGRRLMRLRLDLSGGRRFELGATQSCSSALRNAAEIQNLLATAAADLSAEGVVVLHVQTSENGEPGKILVWRSSGVTALDAAAVRIAGRMAFYPALNDGIPVAVWTEIPVTFD